MPHNRWTREGRCLSYDGKPAIGIDRFVNPKNASATLAPVECDAIADYVCNMLNTVDLDALTQQWMKKP
jgi:hypothetical protein